MVKSNLLCSIGIAVQRANGRMILERGPLPTKLIMEKLSRCMLSVEKECSWAKRELNIPDVGSDESRPRDTPRDYNDSVTSQTIRITSPERTMANELNLNSHRASTASNLNSLEMSSSI